MILADTSAWVEYDRATGSPADNRLTELITDARLLRVTEPVVMEVLSGARDDAREVDLRRLLSRAGLLRFDVATDFDAATRILRENGPQTWLPGEPTLEDVFIDLMSRSRDNFA